MPKADVKYSTLGAIGAVAALRKLERLRTEFEGVSDFKQKLGVAFMSLEGELADVRSMAKIAKDIWLGGENTKDAQELASFALNHLCEMVEDFDTFYQSLWDAARDAA